MAGAIRPEYEVLARDFGALVAGQFGLAVERRLEEELVLLCACFEAIDRHVDDVADADGRERVGEAVLGALNGAAATDLPRELGALLGALRAVLAPRRAGAAFGGALASFFGSTEHLRTTRGRGDFVRRVLEEADRAAEMVLLVVDRLRTPALDRFFVVLSEVANLVDKLHDVRGDARRGEIAVRAGLRLHARLAAALTVRLLRLLRLAPHPLRLAAWGARYLLPPRPSALQGSST